MPYKRKGKIVYHYKNGKWSIKAHAKSIKNAEAMIRLLEQFESQRRSK